MTDNRLPETNESAHPPELEELTHVMIPTESGPPHCTVVPRECEKEELATRWITAAGDSYVSLEEMQ